MEYKLFVVIFNSVRMRLFIELREQVNTEDSFCSFFLPVRHVDIIDRGRILNHKFSFIFLNIMRKSNKQS